VVTDQDRLVAGRYRLSARIGRGGMGTVWLAEDQLLDRRVAVKKLHVPPHLENEERAKLYERTRREARSAARISHNSVTVVHDVVEDQGLPCIVMEYVHSRALSHVVREDGPLTPHQGARVGLAMTGALRAAHGAGVLHRDVKPANVLLSEDGRRVVLTDFGIAAASGTTTLTRTGEFIGSVNYSSPERVQGGEAGEPADAWGLGATLYEAVEGVPPFRKDTWMETAFAIATEPPRHMERAGALRSLIEQLLAKDPGDRLTLEGAQRWLAEAAETVAMPFAAGSPVFGGAAVAGGTGDTSGTGDISPGDAGGEGGTAPTRPHAEAPASQPAVAAPAPAAPPHPRRPRRRRLLWSSCALVAAGALAAGAWLAVQNFKALHAIRSEAPPARATPSSGDGLPKPPPTPAGYKRVNDPLGFSADVPKGWHRKLESNGHDASYIAPSGKTKLLFSVLDFADSDPLRHWRQLEPDVREKSPGYERMRMNYTKYQGQSAAIWEYRWQGRARTFHAIDLGFGETGEKQYALYLSAPDAEWISAKKNFDVAKRSYRVTEPDG
jgi:eukaryotic-like serine/threonine-protein kinase